MPLLSANILICESVLWEKTDVPSAIRTMNGIKIASGLTRAHFWALTYLNCQPGDFAHHIARVQVTDQQGDLMASAEDYDFAFGYRLWGYGPGSFVLATEFSIDTEGRTLPLGCLVSAFLDGVIVAHAPLILLR